MKIPPRHIASGSLMSAALLAASPVFGHAKLLGTDPAAGAQLDRAPTAMTFTFNDKVRMAVLKVVTAGRSVPLNLDLGAAAATVVTVKLPALTGGTYEVQWSALTPSDGHVVKGSYSFVIR